MNQSVAYNLSFAYNINMAYICPICGFSKLKTPTRNPTICPACGTRFGIDDSSAKFPKRMSSAGIRRELTLAWFESGMLWWGSGRERPKDWDPKIELRNTEFYKNLQSEI